MIIPMRRFGWTLSLFALLAGCNGGAPEQSKPHPVATYTHATWKDLPTVSDSDLVAGFEAWRSACERLKRDPVWADTCAAALGVPANATQIGDFLATHLEVYGLRSAQNNANGLILSLIHISEPTRPY